MDEDGSGRFVEGRRHVCAKILSVLALFAACQHPVPVTLVAQDVVRCTRALQPLDEALRIYDELGVPLEYEGCRVEPFVERAAFTETVYGWRTLDVPHRTDGGIDLWVVGRVEGPEGTNWGGAAIRNGCFSTVVVSTLTVPVIMHEIGHALGLAHDLRVGSVMYPEERGAGTWLDERQAEIAAEVAAFLVDECL